jgi:cell division protein FtsN
MAKRKSSSGGGSILYGILAGLLIGLMVAAAVAYYIVKSPSPFVDKASRSPDKPSAEQTQAAPDPNLGLGKRENVDTADATTTQAPIDVPTVSDAPAVQSQVPNTVTTGNDDLGALIASLPKATTSSTRSTKSTSATSSGVKENQAKSDAAKADDSSSSTPGGGTYYLQVGAFKVLEDAETMRARIIMLGMPVEIQRAEVNSMLVNRVRVGPFNRIDDMNRSRARLGEEKISAVVVRQ